MSAGSRKPPDDDAATKIFDSQRRLKAPTQRGYERSADTTQPEAPDEHAAPASHEDASASQSFRVISKKSAPGVLPTKIERPPRQVKIRSMAEVRVPSVTHQMGNLAPPRDAREVRSRRVRDIILWGSVTMIVACIVMLLVWFLAR
jgi:hypothetical protein